MKTAQIDPLAEPIVTRSAAANDRAYKFLLIDEDEHASHEVKLLLSSLFPDRSRIERATGMEHAVSMLRTSGYDVLLLGFDGSNEKGDEALRRLREEAPQVPVILMVPEGTEIEQLLVGRTQADGFMRKHALSPSEVMRSLQAALAVGGTDQAVRERPETRRFRDMVIHAPFAAIMMSSSGVVEFANPAAEALTGYPAWESVGRLAFDFLHPADIRTVQQEVMELRRKPGVSRSLQFRVIRKDGVERTVQASGVNVVEDGKVGSVVVYFRDISDESRRERAIASSERALRSMMESVDDIVFTVDKDLVVTALHGPWVERMGIRREEIVGVPLGMREREGFAVVHVEAARAALRGQPVTYEWSYASGGRTHWVQNTLSPIKDESGETTGLVGVGRDVTALRRASEELRNLSVAISQSPACVVITDLEARIQYVNPKFLEITGYSLEEVLGKNPRMLQSGKTPPGTYASMWYTVTSGRTWSGEFCNRKKDGSEYWESVVIAPLKSPTGSVTGYVAIKQDVTSEHLAKQQLQRSREYFLKAFNASSQAIVVTRLDDAVILEVNDGFVRTFGYERDEVVGKRSTDLGMWAYPREFRALGGRLLRSGTVTGATAALRCKNGEVVEVIGSGNLVEVDGSPAAIIHAENLTEKLKRERELQASRDLFQKVFAASPVASTVVDIDGRIMDVNERWLSDFGFRRNEVIWRQLPELGIDPAQGDAPRVIDLVRSRNLVRDLATVQRRKDGSRAEVLLSAVPLEVDGEPCMLIETVDQTEQRRMQAELRRSEENYRLLFEGNPHPMWVFDHVTLEVLAVNDAAVTCYGFSREEFLGMDLGAIASEEEAKRFRAEGSSSDTSPASSRLWRHRAKDGREFDVEVTSHRISFGGHDAVIVLAQDVTERLAAESRLIASEQRYRKLFDETVNGIFLTHVDGTLEDCNPAFALMFGFGSIEEAMSTNVVGLFPSPEARQRWLDEIKTSVHLENHPVEMRRKDGSPMYAVLNAAAVFDSEGRFVGVHGYVTDDSGRRELERQLRQAQKMESLGTLAGGIAHDFNNILGIILAHQSLLQMNEDLPEKQRSSLEAIGRATERGAGLVRQLLTFARVKEPVLGPVDAAEMIRELERLLTETFPKIIDLDVRIEEGVPLVMADATQLHQVLLNLCVNARDAMLPKGGTLTITLGIGPASGDASAPVAEISVVDTGEGMDDRVRARIFDPFFTTKPKGKGTGLGLSTVFGIIKAHHGTIEVDSAPGHGSAFRFTLPAAGSPTQSKPDCSERAQSLAGTESVLIVEDEAYLRDALSGVFREQGYTVYDAADGDEAVRMISDPEVTIDVVFTDQGLPKRPGIEVIEHLRNVHPDALAVVATGHLEAQERQRLRELRVDAVLLKPFGLVRALEQVRRALDASGKARPGQEAR